MTIFDLFKKHRQGEVSKEKFLYEARRDANLPWILNTTSYTDAIQILKNKGIIKESHKPKPYRSPDKDATYTPGESGKFKSDVRPAFQPKKTAAIRGGEVKVGDMVMYSGNKETVDKIFDDKGVTMIKTKESEYPYRASTFKAVETVKEDKTSTLGNSYIKKYIESVEAANPKGITIMDVVDDDIAKDTGDLYKICVSLAKKGLLNYEKSKGKIKPQDVEVILDSRNYLKDVGPNQMNEDKQPSDAKKAKDGMVVKKDVKEPVVNVAPNIMYKAIEIELGNKYDSISGVPMEVYLKAQAKVIKNLQKNPKHYNSDIFSNGKQIAKADEKLQMQPLKTVNQKDDVNGMKKVKGQVIPKANTKSSTKENKKGKPKGVKELTYNAKKAKGIKKMMPPTGKEKVLEAITKVLKEHSNGGIADYGEYEYGLNHKVKTPEDGEGTIVKSSGGTLTIDLGNGKHKDFQINVIRHANRPQEIKPSEDNKEESKCETCDRSASLMEKMKTIIKKLAGKKKLKKETTLIPTASTTSPDSTAVTAAKNLGLKGVDTRFVQKKPGM